MVSLNGWTAGDGGDDAAAWRRIRDDLSARLVLDGDGVSQLAALALNALVALQNLRAESLVRRRTKKSRRAATACVRLVQEVGRISRGES